MPMEPSTLCPQEEGGSWYWIRRCAFESFSEGSHDRLRNRPRFESLRVKGLSRRRSPSLRLPVHEVARLPVDEEGREMEAP